MKAQIIFSVTRDLIKVRLNNEVKAIAKATATRPIKKGELLTENDLNQIVSIKLTEKDPNSAHITLMCGKSISKIQLPK